MMDENIKKCTLYFCLISLLIGLTCFLSGCNTKFSNYCINYDVNDGIISDYNVNHFQCSDCTEYNYYNKNECIGFRTYPCFSYSMSILYGHNKTCYLNTNVINSYDNYNNFNNYHIGQKLTVLVNNHDFCYLDSYNFNLSWNVGVIILILLTLFILYLLINYLIDLCYHENYIRYYYNPINNNNNNGKSNYQDRKYGTINL